MPIESAQGGVADLAANHEMAEHVAGGTGGVDHLDREAQGALDKLSAVSRARGVLLVFAGGRDLAHEQADLQLARDGAAGIDRRGVNRNSVA